MTNLSLILAYATVVVTGGHVEQIRIVCDQYCTCWRTRYQEHRAMIPDREDLACTTQPPDHGRYNGRYRQGPAKGLGFESKEPVREFSFPF